MGVELETVLLVSTLGDDFKAPQVSYTTALAQQDAEALYSISFSWDVSLAISAATAGDS